MVAWTTGTERPTSAPRRWAVALIAALLVGAVLVLVPTAPLAGAEATGSDAGATTTSTTVGDDAGPTPTVDASTTTTALRTPEPTTTTELDATLSATGTVAGTVTDPNGLPVDGAAVHAYRPADGLAPTASTTTAADGTYTFTGLPDSTDTRIAAVPPAGRPDLRTRWYDDAPTRPLATPLTVGLGIDLAGIDIALTGTTTIAGTVTDGTDPVAGATVAAWPVDAFLPAATATTAADGTFALGDLLPGDHRLQIIPPYGAGLTAEWYDDAPTHTTANLLTPTGTTPVTGITVTLDPAPATPPQTLGAGGRTSCVLDPTGAIDCWGRDDFGQADPPAGTGSTAVTTGAYHGCALDGAGAITCWGRDVWGEATPPGGTGWAELTAGNEHGCALDPAGAITCWGRDSYGQASPPAGTGWTDLATGNEHSCALDPTGAITCWGRNGYDQLDAPAGAGFTDLAADGNHTCALDAAGAITCWGWNGYGQASPPGGTGFTTLTAGYYHSCALDAAGAITCWGRDNEGQASPPGGTGYVELAAGWSHSCARDGVGLVTCWGRDVEGQLGGTPEITLPITAVPLGQASSIVPDLAPDDVTSTWALTAGALPDGLGLDPATGAVTGTPTTVGTFPAELSSTNAFGTTAIDATLTVIDGSPPTLGAPATATAYCGFTSTPIPITVGDPDGSADAVALAVASDDQSRIADGAIALAGTGADRTLTVTAASTPCYDSATVTITATDADGLQATTTIEFILALAPDLGGQITDPAGDPVAGAEVLAYDGGDGYWPSYRTTTDADGRWVMPNVKRTEYRVWVVPPAASSLVAEWFDGASTRSTATPLAVRSYQRFPYVDVQLAGAGAVTGSVTVEGAPLGSATVWAFDDDDTWVGTNKATTAGDGTFTITGLPDGDYRLFAIPATGDAIAGWYDGADDRATATPVTVAAAATAGPVTIALPVGQTPLVTAPSGATVERGATSTPLAITVGDPDGSADDLVVTATSSSQSRIPDSGLSLTGTGTDRSLTITASPTAPAGTVFVTVAATDPDGLQGTDQITVSITVPPDLAGLVTDGTGAAVSGARVLVYDDEDVYFPSYQVTAGTDGRWVLDNIDHDTYRVLVVPPSGSPLGPRWFDGASSRGTATALAVSSTVAHADVDVVLPGAGAITGTVTAATGGAVVVGATVWAYDDDDTWVGTNSDVTDVSGAFTIPGLPPGTYHLYVTPPDGSGLAPEFHADATYRAHAVDVVVTSGGTAGPYAIELDPT